MSRFSIEGLAHHLKLELAPFPGASLMVYISTHISLLAHYTFSALPNGKCPLVLMNRIMQPVSVVCY